MVVTVFTIHGLNLYGTQGCIFFCHSPLWRGIGIKAKEEKQRGEKRVEGREMMVGKREEDGRVEEGRERSRG